MKLAVFASGSGTNFENLVKCNIPVSFLFTDKLDAQALKRAEKLGIKAYTFELKAFDTKAAYEQAILEILWAHEIDLIVLAGYMKIIGPTLLTAYEGRIVNIHPAYLPEFPGAHGIADAWTAGVAESGVTVHYVDAGVDTGQIIAQRRVPILPKDSLESFEARIHEMEYVLYPEVLKAILKTKS